jgi:hypothetical protein
MTLSGSSDVGGAGLNTTTSETECEVATNGATCSVTLYDNAGNSKSCTSNAALINSQPAAPVITSPNDVDQYVDSLTVAITGSDPDGDELIGWYTIDSGAYAKISNDAFVSGSGTSALVSIDTLSDGDHTVTVKTVDTNNFASSEVSQVFTKYSAQVLMPSNDLDDNGTQLASNIISINEGAQVTLPGTLGADGAAIDYEICLTVNNTNIDECVTVTNDPTQETAYSFTLSSTDFPAGRNMFMGGALSTRNTVTQQTVTIPVNIVFYIKRSVPGYNVNDAYKNRSCITGRGNCVLMRDFKGWN